MTPLSHDNAITNSAQIFAEIDQLQSALTLFLQQLVQIPSLPGEEQRAQHFLADKLRAIGCTVEVHDCTRVAIEDHPAFSDDGIAFKDRLNVVATWAPGSQQGRSLILNGHMDVVPTGNAALWKYPPWSGAVEDGKLWGRGSCDMKAGLVAAVFAIEALGNLGFMPAGRVLIESVIGEESGGVGTLTTLVRGFRADAAILMEPTRLRSCPVHAGALSFRLVVTGKAIHASMKRFGVSAIEKFESLSRAIEELDRDRHAKYDNQIFEFDNNIAPISIGTLTAGDWLSTVPETLIAEGRFGVFPGEAIATARAALADSVASVVAADDWLRDHPPQLEWIEGQFEPGETSLTEPIITALGAAHEEVFGSAPQVQGVPYGSDLRLFTQHGKIPAVLYGPGDVTYAHTVEEHVDLDEVFACTKTLALLIVRWCGGRFPQT